LEDQWGKTETLAPPFKAAVHWLVSARANSKSALNGGGGTNNISNFENSKYMELEKELKLVGKLKPIHITRISAMILYPHT
jgi:hypothetical protein